MASLSAEATSRLAARAAMDKNADDVVILDLRGLSSVADFFLVASARSTTQADTIVEAVRMALKAAGTRPRHQEGSADGPVLHHAASLPISGSDLRRRARDGRSLAYRMPEAVAAYIREHRLYGPVS